MFVRWIAIVLGLLCLPGVAVAQTFPPDADWIALQRDGMPVDDVEGDVTGSRDIVGDTTDAAAFIFSDATFLYVRIRLDDDPVDNQGELRPFSWGVEFETDGNLDTFEGLAMVDGIANPDVISLQQNTNQGTIGDPSDAAEVELATYPFMTHGRVVGAATMFGGDEDFFMDFAIPWSDLATLGVTPSSAFGIILGSGNSANAFAADIGTSIADAVTDPIACDANGCTEPMVPVTVTAPVDGSVINDPTPTITGTTEPGATVDITIDAGTAAEETATVTAGAGGMFTYTATMALADGAHSVDVTASVGNLSGTDSVGFDVDTMAPAVSITAPSDGATLNDRRPTVSGTTEPDSTVEIVFNAGTANEVVVAVQADGAGDWSYTPAVDLPTGDNTIDANVTDQAGNTGSDSISVTIDIGADVAINSPTDGSATNDETPTITGTGEPNGMVTVVIDAGTPDEEMATVSVDANGDWSYDTTTTLDEGDHTVDVMQTDSGGDTTTDTATFEVDTTAPMVRITDPADMSTTADSTPGIEGSTSEAGASITIVIDGGTADEQVVTVTADGNGNWSYTPADPITDGDHTVEVSVSDAAGNQGTDTVQFAIDSDLPFIVINQPSDESVINNAQPTISGRADPGAEVTLVFNPGTPDEETVTVTADGAGFWTYVPDIPLDEDKHKVRATVTATDGGMSSDEVDFEIDTTVPGVTFESPEDGETTNDTTPTISGSTEPGATVVVTIGEMTYTTTADDQGDWSVEVTDELAEGDVLVTAQATDEAGNQGGETMITFEVDTTAPTLTIDEPADGDEVSSTPTVSGTGEPGTTVAVFVDGEQVGTTVVGADGTWTLDVGENAALEEGDHDIEAVASDDAGNQTSQTVAVTVPATVVDDRDGDGLSDELEGMLGTDPDNDDTDGDGLLDGAEVNDWSTDPIDPDSDDDGVDDGEEIDNDLNPNKGDTDSDGLGDREELDLGTDPRDVDTDDGGVWDGNEVDRGTDPLDDADDRSSGRVVTGAGCSSVDGPATSGWLLLLALVFGVRRRIGRR